MNLTNVYSVIVLTDAIVVFFGNSPNVILNYAN